MTDTTVPVKGENDSSSTLKKLVEEIKNSIDRLVKLEIVTAVGGVIEDSGSFSLDNSPEAAVMLTKIDLLQGDITTVYAADFVVGRYKDSDLKKRHDDMVKQATDSIDKRLTLLKDLFSFAEELAKKE